MGGGEAAGMGVGEGGYGVWLGISLLVNLLPSKDSGRPHIFSRGRGGMDLHFGAAWLIFRLLGELQEGFFFSPRPTPSSQRPHPHHIPITPSKSSYDAQ